FAEHRGAGFRTGQIKNQSNRTRRVRGEARRTRFLRPDVLRLPFGRSEDGRRAGDRYRTREARGDGGGCGPGDLAHPQGFLDRHRSMVARRRRTAATCGQWRQIMKDALLNYVKWVKDLHERVKRNEQATKLKATDLPRSTVVAQRGNLSGIEPLPKAPPGFV